MVQHKKSKQSGGKKPIPKFGSGILSTGVQKSEEGRVTCTGVFTTFWAWAFPCTRQCHALATVFNLPKGKTSITVSIGKRRTKGLPSIATATVQTLEARTNFTFSVPLTYRFKSDGTYHAVIEFKDYPDRLLLPFEVRTKEWPSLNKKELAFAKRQAGSLPKFQANVNCPGCKHIYVFQVPPYPDASIPGGVLPFPENGAFECVECGKEIQLRDLEGQMLTALRDNIRQRMEGRV